MESSVGYIICRFFRTKHTEISDRHSSRMYANLLERLKWFSIESVRQLLTLPSIKLPKNRKKFKWNALHGGKTIERYPESIVKQRSRWWGVGGVHKKSSKDIRQDCRFSSLASLRAVVLSHNTICILDYFVCANWPGMPESRDQTIGTPPGGWH